MAQEQATELLLHAEALTERFCEQLDALLQQAREQQRALEVDSRQLRRLLDEVGVRVQAAQREGAPTADQFERLQRDHEQLRRQEEQTLAALVQVEESGRRLELLRRQVEMSGRSLRRENHLRPYDPWEMALRSQVLHGREQERSALAREVHDGPAQVLSNLALGLDRCCSGDAPEEMRAAAEPLLRDVRVGLQDVRRFIYDLRPSPLAEEPLGRQVERFVRDLETAYQITVELSWGSPPRDLSPEETVAIYRIVQEALQNARKHARAERIAVESYAEPTGWVVRVSDSGVGFNPSAAWYQEDHWGVRGMRERAQLIGADLQIDSRPGGGTTVLLRLPTRPAEPPEARS